MSRHAFARPSTNQAPSPADSGTFSALTKNAGGPSAPNLRSAGNTDFYSVQHPARASQNASPAQSLSSMSGSERRTEAQTLSSFLQRAQPPHMMSVNSGGPDGASVPIFHLPASAGAAGASKDPNVNVLSVLAPQPQQSSMNLGGMGGAGQINPGGVGMAARQQTTSPQQNLLARLGILGDAQGRKASPKQMDNIPGGYERGLGGPDLRMPMPQQPYRMEGGNLGPSGPARGSYGSPVDDRFEQHPQPLSATHSNDGRFSIHNMNQSQPGSASASNNSFGPSPVGGANPAYALSAKGSRLAKFFESARGGEEAVSPPSMHAPNMGPSHMQGRPGLMTPHQHDDSKDLLTLLQHAAQHPVSFFISLKLYQS